MNGFETFTGRGVLLDEGDWLRFEVPGGARTFLVDLETGRGTVSMVRFQGGTVNRLFLGTQPAHLQKLNGEKLDGSQRSVFRAEYLRRTLDSQN